MCFIQIDGENGEDHYERRPVSAAFSMTKTASSAISSGQNTLISAPGYADDGIAELAEPHMQ
jgi:hypothetical protein